MQSERAWGQFYRVGIGGLIWPTSLPSSVGANTDAAAAFLGLILLLRLFPKAPNADIAADVIIE